MFLRHKIIIRRIVFRTHYKKVIIKIIYHLLFITFLIKALIYFFHLNLITFFHFYLFEFSKCEVAKVKNKLILFFYLIVSRLPRTESIELLLDKLDRNMRQTLDLIA